MRQEQEQGGKEMRKNLFKEKKRSSELVHIQLRNLWLLFLTTGIPGAGAGIPGAGAGAGAGKKEVV